MAITVYEKAQKMAEKCYRSKVQKGEYPYLQVLDEILNPSDVETEVPLGLTEIPMEMIIGTKTAGRTTAFAANFMPLLKDGTEFASKWKTLHSSLLDEGLNTPIKAYEYMNRFYVLEGNKRVSVMKFLDAASIPAMVTRILPKRTDDYENRLYYEFLDFYSLTKINFLILSRLGAYVQLFKLVNSPTEVWSEELRLDFRHLYRLFAKAFLSMGGGNIKVTVGDALLSLMKVYGFATLREMTSVQLREVIGKTWKELAVLAQEETVNLQLHPSEDKPSLLRKILPERLRIAFVHDKTAKTSSWTYGHEFGRAHIDHIFGDKIETACFDGVSEARGPAVLQEIIDSRFNMIITTTPRLMKASLQVAADHPEIMVMNCSLGASHPILRTYYARMYEAKFLIGMIAGAMAENNELGYLADYPLNGMVASVNAFALGARMVNPRATVHLRWSTMNGGFSEEDWKALGVSYVSGRDWIMPQELRRRFGLYRVGGDGTNVAMPVWDWGNLYERIVRRAINGNWNNEDAVREKRALNYYWGISAGVVDVLYSKSLPDDLAKLVELMKQQIASGAFEPFGGVLINQQHEQVQGKGQSLSTEAIIRMDWLAENVEGRIPAMRELSGEAQAVLEVQGVLGDV